jgi:hypothetical protein
MDDGAAFQQHAVCSCAFTLPLASICAKLAGGPCGPPCTVAPLASLVTEAASTIAVAFAFSPWMVTASPGFTANTSWVERCGGRCTSVPSASSRPSTSPRGVSRYWATLPFTSGNCAGS